MVIRPTSAKAGQYVWFGRHCLRGGGSGTKAIVDGGCTVICKYGSGQAILIALNSGIASHPRSGSLRKIPYWDNQMNQYYLTSVDGGGWNESLADLTAVNSYPLTDDDNGTWLIASDAAIAWDAAENYGNVAWVGIDSVLTWKGPPNGFTIASVYNIPGLSNQDFNVVSGTFYTTFGEYIYEDGAQLCKAPQSVDIEPMQNLVVGASYATDSSGAIWLICISVFHNADPNEYYLKVSKSSDSGVTWTEIHSETAPHRAKTTAQVSVDGRTFVFNGSIYQISADVALCAVVTSVPSTAAGSKIITNKGGYGSTYTYSGELIEWPGLDQGEALAYTKTVVTASFEDADTGDATSGTTSVPVYLGNPATSITIAPIDAEPLCSGNGVAINLAASVNGAYCSIQWSGVQCSRGAQATKFGCSGTVTATLSPQGVSDTYTITPLSSLTISGPFAPVSGSQYSSNGYAPFTWSITGGMNWGIDSTTGVITQKGCGIGTIEVTDSCGSVGTKIVKGDGHWVKGSTTTVGTMSGANWIDNRVAEGPYCGCNDPYITNPLNTSQCVHINSFSAIADQLEMLVFTHKRQAVRLGPGTSVAAISPCMNTSVTGYWTASSVDNGNVGGGCTTTYTTVGGTSYCGCSATQVWYQGLCTDQNSSVFNTLADSLGLTVWTSTVKYAHGTGGSGCGGPCQNDVCNSLVCDGSRVTTHTKLPSTVIGEETTVYSWECI